MGQAFSIEHEDCQGVHTHEDCEGELGFFWATKIGGPSHGFDFEAQCLLPLLANARHKVILCSIPSYWPHPLARAHFRLLWTAPSEDSARPESEARLWLETVNLDFSADEAEVIDVRTCTVLVLRHAIRRAIEMQVALSVSAQLQQALSAIAKDMSCAGTVRKVQECLVLRPSNGVVEASDYLSSRHDWVQLEEEVTEPLKRALFVPAGCAAHAPGDS